MATLLMFPPKVHFNDLNGDPLSGGKVFTYEPGTTTPKDTYQDKDQVATHTNPIILDSRGEAEVWLNGEYKFVIKDSNDVEIYTVDNASTEAIASVLSEWLITGDTPTFISTTQFSVPTDLTATYHVGRRVRLVGTAGTIYGVISASAFTTLTTVTVVLDSGSIDSGISISDVGLLSNDNQSHPEKKHLVVSKTSAYTANASDNTILVDASGGAVTITLPTAVGIKGREYIIKKIDSSANAVTIDGDGSETIDGVVTKDLENQYHGIKILSGGTNWEIIHEYLISGEMLNVLKTQKGEDIVSATALAPGTDGNFFDVTGTTPIESINSLGIGTAISLQFDGSLSLIHDAVNLILPGGVNIGVTIGEVYTFREYDTGKWILESSTALADGVVTHSKLAEKYKISATADYTAASEVGSLGMSDSQGGSGATGSIVNGTDSDDRWLLLRADNNNDWSYSYSTADITRTEHETVYKMRIKTDTSIDDIQLWFALQSDRALTREDSTPDVELTGFRYSTDVDGTAFWRAVTINGTGASANVTTTATAIAVSTIYRLEIRITATEHKFYINEVLVATHTTTLPTLTTGLTAFLGVLSRSNTGSDRGFKWNTIDLIKE